MGHFTSAMRGHPRLLIITLLMLVPELSVPHHSPLLNARKPLLPVTCAAGPTPVTIFTNTLTGDHVGNCYLLSPLLPTGF